MLHGIFGFISWRHFNTDARHAWLCVRAAVSLLSVLIILQSSYLFRSQKLSSVFIDLNISEVKDLVNYGPKVYW